MQEDADVEGRKNFAEDDGCAQHQQHGAENDGHCLFALVFAALFAVATEDGDEGNGSGAACQQIGEHVGQLKRGGVGIGERTRAEQERDDLDAHQSNDTG